MFDKSLGWSAFGALLISTSGFGRAKFRSSGLQAVRRKQPGRRHQHHRYGLSEGDWRN